MLISKNKKYQYLFFFILLIYTIFNGGNSEILIQLNFILISLLFLYCLKDKNYKLHLNIFYTKNKTSIIFFIFFLFYLIFQILPIPVEYLKIFSPIKYDYLQKLQVDILYSSISLSPSNSIFQIINFLSLLLIIFIIKMIFYRQKHIHRFYIFVSLLGALTSFVALIFYLSGNETIFFLSNLDKSSSSTGFFINRTVFSIFLLFCFIASLEILKHKNSKNFF